MNDTEAPLASTKRRAKVGRARHHVYVVELDEAVLEETKFVRANPSHRYGMRCLYVGMTGLDPDLRFDRHKAGIQANRYVTQYGLRLLPELYAIFNPMPYAIAAAMEQELAEELREKGYAVWQA